MLRMSTRLLLMLALLGSTLVLYGAAHAQATNEELRPIANDVALDAFAPSVGFADGGAGASVQETKPLTAPKQFTDMQLSWQTSEPAGSTLQVEVRVSDDGATWTKWVVVNSDDTMTDDAKWSTVFYVDKARFYQLRTTTKPGPDGAQPSLTDIQVHTLYVEDLPLAEPPVTFSDSAPNAELNALAPQPSYVSRTGWGNPQGEYAPDAPPNFRTATHLVVHHTADANSLSSNEPNWAARVRAEWSFHTFSRGWGDIGYNWLIDPNGVIYAGRAGSTDTWRDAVGFHDTANHGSMGVSVMGTYTTVKPTAASQTSLVNLLAWKASQRGIDPLGRSFYYGCSISRYCYPYNSGSVVPNIAGHRQVTPGHTACPGDAFMSIMQDIRNRVAQKINATPPRYDNGDLYIDNKESTFSPIGDLFEATSCGYLNQTNWSWVSSANDGITNDAGGVWRPKIPSTGQYKVRVHIPSCSGIANVTTNARYEIGHASGKANVTVNQSTQRGWVELGTFSFSAGTNGYVRLTDLTSESYYDKRAIFFDAVQWIPVSQPSPTPSPTPPPTSSTMPVQLVGASIRTPMIATGEVLEVEFKVKNTGTQPIPTQAPDAGIDIDPERGWVYDESECFMGGGGAPVYDRVPGSLRLLLGFADGSGTTPSTCPSTFSYPWRWGVNGSLQPGETRTVLGYVRFRTPGTYTLNANMVNEGVGLIGSDGKGTAAMIGSVNVTPEGTAPVTVLLDRSLNSLAAVYTLNPMPSSLLGRTTNPLSIVEDEFIGTFAWDGRDMNWGDSGPNGQTDRFIVRQTRAFYAPTAGTYRFRVTSDDGGWLWVDGKLVATNPGLHATSSAEGSVSLSAGMHTIAVKTFEYVGGAYVGYSWLPPGAPSFATIPSATSGVQAQGGVQQITIAADDMGGSGISVLRYRIDDGPEQQSSTGLATASVPEGTHTLNYQAQDKNGNTGSWKTATVTVVTPMSCKLTGTPSTNGSINLAIGCSDARATQFEIQVRDTGTGVVRTLATRQRQLTFFGTPGHTYEFRMRAGDGTTWGPLPSTPEATLSVPANASFTRIHIPRAGQ